MRSSASTLPARRCHLAFKATDHHRDGCAAQSSAAVDFSSARSFARCPSEPPEARSRSYLWYALRIHALAKGYSGIRSEIREQMISAFNADCIPIVPCKGTVGASGDLAPLAHIALGLSLWMGIERIVRLVVSHVDNLWIICG